MITAAEILDALMTHTNVLLYGQPGTGKSHLMKEVQNLFERRYGGTRFLVETTAERDAISESIDSTVHSRWVTFHQGYSYEDFIIGLRPKVGPTGHNAGSLALEPRAGALLELAAYAKDSHGLMIIDEINRGNASKIFGEFITLMESDKRLADDGSPSDLTVTVTLPYLAQGEAVKISSGVELSRQFSMPKRIYTLASMNSVDKSVAPLDSAIRRRFYVVHIRPNDADLTAAAGVNGSSHGVAELAVQIIRKINRGIGIYLGPDYMFGQYYLPADPKLGEQEEEEAKRSIVRLWRHKIVPQLLELFQSRPGVCESLLELNKIPTGSGVELISATNEEADEGGMSYVVNTATETPDDEIYDFLIKFAAA